MKLQTRDDNIFAHKHRLKTRTFKQNMLEISINKDLIVVQKEDVGEKLIWVVLTHTLPKFL